MRGHDPRDLRLAIYEQPGSPALPGWVEVSQSGIGTVGAREAVDVLRLKPTRQYGRCLTVTSTEVGIPGLLLPDYRRETWRGALAPIPRPLSSDIGALSAVLMWGVVPQRWFGRAQWGVMALAYHLPPCNPAAQFEPLREKVDALDASARRFARDRRLPLFLARLYGDAAHGQRGFYTGHLSAEVAAIASRDPGDLAALAFEARMHHDGG